MPKVFDEIPARLQEIIVFDSRKAEFLKKISEASIKNNEHTNEALSIVETIIKEHINAMHEAKIDKIVVDPWVKFHEEFQNILREANKGISVSVAITANNDGANERLATPGHNLASNANPSQEDSHIREALERRLLRSDVTDAISPSPNLVPNKPQSKDRSP